MGNTTVRWMTLYRQERKVHQAEIEKLTKEYEDKLLAAQMKNKWLSDQLIATQAQNRTLTHEIARKEVLIDDLQTNLRRKKGMGRSTPKKTSGDESIASESGERVRNICDSNRRV